MEFSVQLADETVVRYHDKDTFSIEQGSLKVIKGDGGVEIYSPTFWRKIDQPVAPEPVVESVHLPA
ncbi:hypothetical protein ACWDYH_18295 [Nocardia goodfellowii]|uniref:Uncharacterized protein n=1 Tax=Nocardia goodfellowii TaxID=882446 RepID=A0ABS4QNB2_9NOCA|nr:hypothetical protein [Nocardia goodfellowii]MBP2193195.1 hypothetical protein [Nocardia goodfellowii]